MHRDVKPGNIFLNDDRVIIGDFGLSKQGVDLTSTSLGSPLYMAPEIASYDTISYGSKADLWSIGVLFYELLFGKCPFEGKS